MNRAEIADTFTDSLAKLTGQEQKAVKTTAFDLQLDPTSPGMRFHKLDRAKDPNFWSVRVSRDIRMIVHKTAASLLLCYVDLQRPGAQDRHLRRPGSGGLGSRRMDRGTAEGRVSATRNRCLRPLRTSAEAGESRPQGFRRQGGRAWRQGGDDGRPRLDQHHAPGEGA
jgi:mRNA-degrading endonuclease RelE of RelBE toxin-antitoxin system